MSYMHAEWYPAAEMKHGQIALIDGNTPVVFLAPKDDVYAKVVSNMQEVRARGGRIIVITSEGNGDLRHLMVHQVPQIPVSLARDYDDATTARPHFLHLVSDMQAVRARGGRIIVITSEGNGDLRHLVDHQLCVPAAAPLLSPLLTVIPLQLLAYHIAVRRGCDVDRPRNLAKSVTVE